MAISKSNFKLYLTSVEPGVEQTIKSQSLGGYPAIVTTDLTKSLVYPETTFSSSDGLNSASLTVSDYTKIAGKSYLSIYGEIAKITPATSNSISVVSRGVNSVRHAVLSGDVCRGVATDLFNNNFNKSFKQYRCIAIQNNSTLQSAYSARVFLKKISTNLESTVRVAVEIPKSDYEFGIVDTDSSNKKQVITTTYIGAFDDNLFEGAVLRALSGSNAGQTRIIASFDSDTGTILVDSDFPFLFVSGDTFEVDPGPCQRIVSGTVAPEESDYISDFVEAQEDTEISIDVNGLRSHGGTFQPKDVIYVWLERSLRKTALSFPENNVSLTVRYELS